MRACLRPLLIAISALALCATRSAAHDVGGAIQLGFNGLAAPFGFEGEEVYTDVSAEGQYAYLGTEGSGVAVLNLDTGAFPSGVLRNPELVTVYAPPGHQDYQDIKVQGGVGYFSGGLGTDLVNLSDPSSPSLLARISPSQGGHATPKNAAVGGGYLYQVAGDSPDIKVFDVSTPAVPALVRTIDTSDSVGLSDVTLVGDTLYAAGLGGGVYAYDVGAIGVAQPPLAFSTLTGALTSSVWPTADGERIVVTHRENGGELAVWDITAPTTILDSKNADDLGFVAYSTAEVAVMGSYAYVAWHQGGLEVIDIDQVDTLGMQRAGYYVVPGSSVFQNYSGVRSVFPWLGPSQVLMVEVTRGLYRIDASALVAMPGDYNNDKMVDSQDYNVWRALYGTVNTAADGNGDGLVNAADYVIWRDAVAASPAPGTALGAPEPCGLALLVALLSVIPINRFGTPWNAP